MADIQPVKTWDNTEGLLGTDLTAEFANLYNNAVGLSHVQTISGQKTYSASPIYNDNVGPILGTGSDAKISYDGTNVVLDPRVVGSGLLQVLNAQEVRGDAGAAGSLLLSTAELTAVDGDILGRIDFQAPLEASGTDAILVGASIWAEADDTFAADNNDTDLVFAVAESETAAERMRLSYDGTTVGLTFSGVTTISTAAGALNLTPAAGSAIVLDGTINVDAGVVTGATSITSTAFVGDITGDVTGNADTFTATANNSANETVYPVFVDGATGAQGAETDTGLTYNPSTGLLSTATLTTTGVVTAASLDISGDADIDGTLEADAITLGGTALGSLYSPIAGSSSIVTTGALNSGSITSGFGNINTGSSTITTTGAVSTGALTSTGNISFDGGSFVFNESGADKDFRIEGDTNANLFVADASEDKIGIGTATPGPGLVTMGGGVAATTVRIDIDGGSDNGKGAQLAFRSGSTDKFYIGDAASLQGGSESSRDMTLYTTSGVGVRFYTDGNNRRMDITSDGDLQMAAGSDITQAAGNDMNFKVSVNRDIIFSDTAEIGRFTGAGSTLQLQGLTASQDVQTDGSKNLTSVSDQNWKNDLGLIDNATAIINKLQPRYFTWKKDSQGDFTDPDQPRLAGFFAQEVYVAFPEGSPGGANTDADGVDHWGLNGRALLALAVRGLQELDKRVSALE